MCSNETVVWQNIQVAPRRLTVPPGGSPAPTHTSKERCDRPLGIFGLTNARLELRDERTKELTNGIRRAQAGFGHEIVRAHSHAIAVSSSPTYSFKSGRSLAISFVIFTFG